MIEASRRSFPCSFNRLRGVSATVACLFAFGTFLDCAVPDGAVERGTVGRSPRPIDANPYSAELIGREALEKIGYLPILSLARQAGWVTTKRVMRPALGDRPLISMDIAQVETVSQFMDVMTKYAVAAGVASQLDSPFPGPGDVVGVGIIVIGLLDAGLLAGILLKGLSDVSAPATTGTTTSPPAGTKSDQDPKPEGEPRTTGTTSPPTGFPPEPEKETCGEMLPQYIRCDDPKISHYPFGSENAAFRSIKVKGIRKEKLKEKARKGPCVGRGGFHTNVLQQGNYVASIVGCDCCDDSGDRAIIKEKAGVEYH